VGKEDGCGKQKKRGRGGVTCPDVSQGLRLSETVQLHNLFGGGEKGGNEKKKGGKGRGNGKVGDTGTNRLTGARGIQQGKGENKT